MNKGLKYSAYIAAALVGIGTIYAGITEGIWIAPVAYILIIIGFIYLLKDE
tara:strand:+ start:2463 stop:2615 length:153 start_codon:yes stop_codon:yes gene_type:complete